MEVPHRVVTAGDLAALFRAEAATFTATATEMDRVGRPDESAVARAESALLARCLG